MSDVGGVLKAVARRVRYWSPLGPEVGEMRRLMRSGRLVYGPGSYGVPKFRDYDASLKVVVGNYSSIGAILMIGGQHQAGHVTTYPFRTGFGIADGDVDQPPGADTHIGSDVWLGNDSVIMSGVTVGDGAIVGTHAVVTKDVPPFAVVAGVPARVIRFRHTEAQREALLRIQWWNWSEQKIREAMPLLASDRIDEFIQWAETRPAD